MLPLFLASLAVVPPASSRPACPDVLDYRSWRESPGQQWDYRSPDVLILGASHVRDPEHEQFARFAREFAAAKPTLVFFEGPDRGLLATSEQTIRKMGESGFARFLAKEAGVPARSLEPPPAAQLEALVREFPQDQVLLFFTLREAARLRDREGLTGGGLDEAMGKLLGKVAALGREAGLDLAFTDVAGLQKAFERYWPNRSWRTAQSSWFSPLGDDASTGGVFLARINRADSRNRDRHMVRQFADGARRGDRLFVVVGRNHVPMITQALDCALRK